MQKRNIFILLGILLMVSNCSNYEYFPDMHYSPSVNFQQYDEIGKRNSTFTIPQNTVKYQAKSYSLSNKEEDYTKAESLTNPYSKNKDLLKLGKEKYRAYCAHCHGLTGLGDGPIKQKWSGILPIVSTKDNETVPPMNWGEGRIYHVIRVGIRSMPAHASQMRDVDMWSVARYVKELQKNKGVR